MAEDGIVRHEPPDARPIVARPQVVEARLAIELLPCVAEGLGARALAEGPIAMVQ